MFVYTTLPNTFQPPVLKVTRTGGTPGTDTMTAAPTVGNDRVIDIETLVIANNRGDLWEAVQEVETAMSGLTANGDADWYVDEVTEVFAFAVDNYENETKQRAIATYGLTVRPVP